MERGDDDVEKVRVGEDEVGDLLLPEPGEIIVLLRCPILRLSRPGVDNEDASVELRSGQPRDKARSVGGDHDSEFFEQLAGKGFEIRLALLDVTSGRVPAVWSPLARRASVHEQDAS